MAHIYIFLTVGLTVYGQLILKQQIGTLSEVPSGIEMIPFFIKFTLLRPLVLSGFIAGLLASLAWMAAISRFELSYAYPFMSLNFVVVVLLSFLLFNEALNPYKIVGLGLICIGVFVLSRGA